MTEEQQYSQICKGRFDTIENGVERLIDCILGNGKSGLKTEFAVVKARQKWLIGTLVFLLIYFVVPEVKNRLWNGPPHQTVETLNK